MSYSRTNWVSGETPLSAGNMNNIEDGIEELNSNLGKSISIADATKSVPTGGAESTVLQTVTLPPGKYIFVAMVSFAANTSGMRGISITTSSSPQPPYYVSASASNGGSTSMQVTRLIDTNSSVTLKVVARQTSGSALSVTAHSSIFQLK